MSAKKVSFGTQPPPKPAVTPDNWVEGKAEEGTKRLTIDLPASLHKRVKIGCATREVKIADLVREFFEREFPELP